MPNTLKDDNYIAYDELAIGGSQEAKAALTFPSLTLSIEDRLECCVCIQPTD